MKKISKNSITTTALALSLALVTSGLSMPAPALAATAPNLGVAAGYSVFGNAGITETATLGSHLWGNAGGNGLGHASLIATQVDGSIDAGANVPVVGAISTAYGNLAGEAQTGVVDLATSPSVGPGVYDIGATAFDSTLTLNGAGVYIFRSSSSIAQTAGGTMLLTNGATACNVFWQIPTSMTFTAVGNIEGTIITNTGLISFVSGVNLKGRAWAATQVTMDNNQITEPTCETPTPTTITVTIDKYIDGVKATPTNAESLAFPMSSTWTAANLNGGVQTSGTFNLDTGNSYEAATSPMDASASYTTSEDTTGNNVGASCAAGKPFALVGYSTGTTLAAAVAATPSATVPNFTNLQSNQFVIVWNKDCTPANLTIVKKALGGNGTFNFSITGGPSTPTVPATTTISGWATTSVIQLESGAYDVNEASQSGWTLNSHSCVYNNQSIGSPIANGEHVTLDAGDSVTCTFTNTKDVGSLLKVHILKYLDGAKATAVSTGGYQFPMTSTWKTANLNGGATTSGAYVLGNNHGGAPDLYGADTSAMQALANYTTSEVTGGSSQVVSSLNQCTPGKYLLNGYRTSSVSFAAAAAAPLVAVAPIFYGLSSDYYVVVDNLKCPAVATTGSISGMKYNDLNRNGKKEANEPGLAGWVIKLKLGNNVIATTTTDINGNYSFNDLALGKYKVRETQKNGWKRMSKNPKAIVITAGSVVTDVNFGNAQKKRTEREDTERECDRDEQFGDYHGNRGRSNYENDQGKRDHNYSWWR